MFVEFDWNVGVICFKIARVTRMRLSDSDTSINDVTF